MILFLKGLTVESGTARRLSEPKYKTAHISSYKLRTVWYLQVRAGIDRRHQPEHVPALQRFAGNDRSEADHVVLPRSSGRRFEPNRNLNSNSI